MPQELVGDQRQARWEPSSPGGGGVTGEGGEGGGGVIMKLAQWLQPTWSKQVTGDMMHTCAHTVLT